MVQPFQPTIAGLPEAAFFPSLQNPAVALCTEVWQKVHAATMNLNKNIYTADRCAAKAYRLAMPPLSGYQNICDFIACAGYGMLLGAIKEENGTKLLYAAQVALTTVPRESKTQSRTDPRQPAPPSPPPISPQPTKKKRDRPKKPASTPENKEVAPSADGGNSEPFAEIAGIRDTSPSRPQTVNPPMTARPPFRDTPG